MEWVPPDILVMGVGRSGTSTTSRILHTRLNVCMGHEFCLGNKVAQPEGSYESRTMLGVTKSLVSRYGLPLDEWKTAWTNTHYDGCGDQLRGAKVTHFAALKPHILREFKPRLVIRTWRNREDTVASLNRWRGHKKVDWSKFYDNREANMDHLENELEGEVIFKTIGFPAKPEVVTDDDIVEILKPFVESLEIER